MSASSALFGVLLAWLLEPHVRGEVDDCHIVTVRLPAAAASQWRRCGAAQTCTRTQARSLSQNKHTLIHIASTTTIHAPTPACAGGAPQAFFVLAGGAYVALGVIRSEIPMFVVSGVLGLGLSVPFGFLRGLMSKGVSASRQGQTMAGICAVQVGISVVAPALFNSLYTALVAWSPGVCLYLMGGLTLFGAGIVQYVARTADHRTGEGAPLLAAAGGKKKELEPLV